MIVSYNWLQTYFKKKLPTPEKIGEILTFSVFEIESIEKKEKDTLLDVKVLPDRAHYALCHRGIAGEVAAAMGEKINLMIEGSPKSSKEKILNIQIVDSADCRRYIGRRVSNVKIGKLPDWFVEKLESIGQRSINNIVDAANFVMFDMGQPLHAFDAEKVKGAIVVRRAKSDEKITTLDNREIVLDTETLVIADENGPLAIAGIKGGKRAEVGPETKNLILEAANFNPTLIRKTTQRLGIQTDASKRFENEITPELAGKAMNEFSALIAKLSPESSFGEVTDNYPVPVSQTVIEVRSDLICDLLGVKISEKEIVAILDRPGLSITKKAGGVLSITVPFERLDLKIPEDIVEEVGRLYGYDKVLAVLPTPETKPLAVLASLYYESRIGEILISLGFSEVYTSSFDSKGEMEVLYPMASDKNFLRTNLAEHIAASLKFNAVNAPLLGLDTIKIFEIGKVFPKTGEETHLALGFWNVKKSSADPVAEAKTALEKEFGLMISEKSENRILEINFGALIAKLPAPKNWDLRPLTPIAAATKFQSFSKYPFIVRDIAMFVPSVIPAKAGIQMILDSLSSAEKILLTKNPTLFDEYKKADQTSYAFRLIFQSADRTLTDTEINKIMEKISSAVISKGWKVR